jgi:dipeptide/tripeptide permease
MLVGLTVERISYAAGFHVAAGGALLVLVLFVIAERRGPRRFTLTGAGGMM